MKEIPKVPLLLIFISFSLTSFASDSDRLNIISRDADEKICLDLWKKQCGDLKEDKIKFIECTRTKMNPSCKKVLKNLLADQQKNEDRTTAPVSDEIMKCNEKLRKLCPDKSHESNIDQAACFKNNFKKIDEQCQKELIRHLKKND